MTKFAFRSHSLADPLVEGAGSGGRPVTSTYPRSAGYPPFDIVQTAANRFAITLAVAGFRDEDITITAEDRQLVVRGQQPEARRGRVFLHRGIATRPFRRAFALPPGVEVAGARLENGLLVIAIERADLELEPRSIPIVRK